MTTGGWGDCGWGDGFDIRGMTCAQAMEATQMPCRGVCTHDTDSRPGPSSPSVIVDPDCFRDAS